MTRDRPYRGGPKGSGLPRTAEMLTEHLLHHRCHDQGCSRPMPHPCHSARCRAIEHGIDYRDALPPLPNKASD